MTDYQRGYRDGLLVLARALEGAAFGQLLSGSADPRAAGAGAMAVEAAHIACDIAAIAHKITDPVDPEAR